MAATRDSGVKEGLQEKKSLSYLLDLASIKELFFYTKKWSLFLCWDVNMLKSWDIWRSNFSELGRWRGIAKNHMYSA